MAKTFVPNGKAARFIKMIGEGKTFISMFIGANSTSKTSTGANIIVNICYGVQTEWFDYPVFHKFPYKLRKGRIISDPTTIKEKIIPELKKWLPENEAKRLPEANYETAKEGKYYESKFFTNTGWEIDIMSTEQALKEYESVDLSFVWIDEPIPRDRFMATIARGRLGMLMFWTYTPLFHSGWVKDWIDTKRMDEGTGFVDYVEAEMEDNCQIHGERGFLEHDNILKMSKAFSEDEREARVFGRFGHLIGKVHKLFKRGIHVIKPFPITERLFTVYHALDPHPRVPDHALWLAVDKKGTKIICSELISEGTPKLLGERIKAVETAQKYRMQDRIIDPSAYIDDQHNEKASLGKQLRDLGLHYIKGSKDLQAGIKRTDTALDYQMIGGDLIVAPELYIFDTCPVTIKQLENYVWDEWRGSTGDGKKLKGSPRDKDDHMPENLHRLLLHEPSFIPYSPLAKQQRIETIETFDPYERIKSL